VSGWKAAVKGLEDSIALAQHLFDHACAEAAKNAESDNANFPYLPVLGPEDMKDNNGRPLLLDAAVSLASARASLVTALTAKR
jgi:hypothetical protein